MRELKQYIELYHLSGIADFFLNLSKQKPTQQIPPKKIISHQSDIPEPIIQLWEKCKACSSCKYRNDRTKLVFGKGSLKAKCLILGNPVNADENLSGEPFGKSNSSVYADQFARIIKKGLIEGEKLSITKDDLYLTNITKCRAKSLDYEEIKKCLPFLRQQIDIIKPKIILVFGEVAANALFGKTENINYYRNNQGLSFQNIPVYVTFNPIDMIKTESLKKIAWMDLKHFAQKYRDL